jgi:hypothetical protein
MKRKFNLPYFSQNNQSRHWKLWVAYRFHLYVEKFCSKVFLMLYMGLFNGGKGKLCDLRVCLMYEYVWCWLTLLVILLMAVRGMNIMSAMHKQAVCIIDSSLALPRMGLCLELMNIKVNERRKIAAEVFNIYVFTCACLRACVLH